MAFGLNMASMEVRTKVGRNLLMNGRVSRISNVCTSFNAKGIYHSQGQWHDLMHTHAPRIRYVFRHKVYD